MNKEIIMYRFIGDGMSNLRNNTINIVSAFHVTKTIKYSGQELDNKILWIFAHGLNKPKSGSKEEKIKIFNYINEKDITESYYDDFMLKITSNVYLKSRNFPNFFKCKNCKIIIDSCYSNTIDISTINKFIENNNQLFLSGYEREFNSCFGSTLNLFLYDYSKRNNINDIEKLKNDMEKFNKLRKKSLIVIN